MVVKLNTAYRNDYDDDDDIENLYSTNNINNEQYTDEIKSKQELHLRQKCSKLTSYSYALNWSVVHLVKRDQSTLEIAGSILLVAMSFMKNLLMINRVTARLTWLKGTPQDRIKVL